MRQLMNVMVWYEHSVSFVIKTRYVICHSVTCIFSDGNSITAYALSVSDLLNYMAVFYHIHMLVF